MLWELLPAVLAAAIIVGTMEITVRVIAMLRKRDYVRHEDKSSADIRSRLALPEGKTEGWPKDVEPIVQRFRKAHQQAIDEQGRYHAAVVRSATCLALTFCAMALSTTRVHGEHITHLVIVSTEVLALSFLYFNFRAGIRANRTWIAKRIQTELLRQDQFISLLFPVGSKSEPGPASDVETKRDAIERHDGLDAVESINTYWSARRRSIEVMPIDATVLTGPALLCYLHKRAVRQLGWFSDSIARLEHNAHARSRRLALLFCASLMLAVIKLVLILHRGDVPHYEASGLISFLEAAVPPVLIVIAGWSATEAAYYLNQNARSLIHRYRNQVNRMAHWFDRAKTELPLAALPATELEHASKEKARALVLEFEDLMVEELVDWIYIAKLDAIEIAP